MVRTLLWAFYVLRMPWVLKSLLLQQKTLWMLQMQVPQTVLLIINGLELRQIDAAPSHFSDSIPRPALMDGIDQAFPAPGFELGRAQ